MGTGRRGRGEQVAGAFRVFKALIDNRFGLTLVEVMEIAELSRRAAYRLINDIERGGVDLERSRGVDGRTKFRLKYRREWIA